MDRQPRSIRLGQDLALFQRPRPEDHLLEAEALHHPIQDQSTVEFAGRTIGVAWLTPRGTVNIELLQTPVQIGLC